MVSCAENGVALWGPRLRDSVLPMCEQLSERAGGDEVSLALQLLPSEPLTHPLSHLWCPCLWCWSQTVLDPATQRSDHRWVTLHLRTCFLSCGMWDHLHRAVVHTWDDARKVQSWVVAIIGAEQSFCVWGLISITESLCLGLTCRLTTLRANCGWVWLSWTSSSGPEVPQPCHPDFYALTSISSSPVPFSTSLPEVALLFLTSGNLPRPQTFTATSHFCYPVPSSLYTGPPDTSSPPYTHCDLVKPSIRYHAPYVLCPLVMRLHTAKCLLHVCFAVLRKQSDEMRY